jgi:hypothetical protein
MAFTWVYPYLNSNFSLYSLCPLWPEYYFSPKKLDKKSHIWYSKADLEEGVSVRSFGPLQARNSAFFQVERINEKKKNRMLAGLAFLKKYAAHFKLSEGSPQEPDGLKKGKLTRQEKSAGEPG